MNTQSNLKVNTLLLTWRPIREAASRYLVGYLRRSESGYTFEYALNTQDFIDAKDHGFSGYPAFKIADRSYNIDVLSSFAKRLPPASRGDFSRFLAAHMVAPGSYEDAFELISYTGIRLPSDGFDLIPDLGNVALPFNYLVEVAGTRYNISTEEAGKLSVGDRVNLFREDDNQYDSNAIAVMNGNMKIGYINRLHCRALRALIANGVSVSCRIARLNGTQERPLIFVMLSVF
ncbi:HIRAN domain-containing protein [Zhongshania borealis]|uniref:HIRAN domain-containing protein n=1 Tax=Zhongshania borealis TaxID=889488 RepID=A0ABP7WA63_9GAMM